MNTSRPMLKRLGAQREQASRMFAWYRAEQRLRNRIDREYGIGTPLDYGPVESPDVDVRGVLGITH